MHHIDPAALRRAHSLLAETAEQLSKIQSLISAPSVIEHLSPAQIMELQQLDLATQSVRCVSECLLAVARNDSEALSSLRPHDLAARLLGNEIDASASPYEDELF